MQVQILFGDSRWWGSLTMIPAGNKTFVCQPYHKKEIHHAIFNNTAMEAACAFWISWILVSTFLWNLGKPAEMSWLVISVARKGLFYSNLLVSIFCFELVRIRLLLLKNLGSTSNEWECSWSINCIVRIFFQTGLPVGLVFFQIFIIHSLILHILLFTSAWMYTSFLFFSHH